jgi:hypothetical protein
MILGKGNSDNYFILMDKFTEWLSHAYQRLTIAGETRIMKIKINSENRIEIHHTDNFITHCMGVDMKSLYLSCFSSSINFNILYTSGQMYMPDNITSIFQMWYWEAESLYS